MSHQANLCAAFACQQDRQKLRGALTNVQQNFQQSATDRAVYAESVRQLADTEVTHLNDNNLSNQARSLLAAECCQTRMSPECDTLQTPLYAERHSIGYARQ